jgi:hypothetical protein
MKRKVKASESGVFLRVPRGEALRVIAKQHGLVVLSDDTDETIQLKLADVTIPVVGVASQYP